MKDNNEGLNWKLKQTFLKKDKIIAIKRIRTKTGLKKIKWWVMKLKKENKSRKW
jgi:ribosomal protein L7/L12